MPYGPGWHTPESDKLKAAEQERGLLRECEVKLIDARGSVVPSYYASNLLKRIAALNAGKGDHCIMCGRRHHEGTLCSTEKDAGEVQP